MGKAGLDLSSFNVTDTIFKLFTKFGVNASQALGGISIVTFKKFNKIAIGEPQILLAKDISKDGD
jgi:hypothetical protein